VDKFSIINGYAVSGISVDETLIQIDGQNYWLWRIDYEPRLNACIMIMHLLKERTMLVYYQLFKELRDRYGRRRKPTIFTDGATWCNDEVCRCLRL
jgi:transposase-like protein